MANPSSGISPHFLKLVPTIHCWAYQGPARNSLLSESLIPMPVSMAYWQVTMGEIRAQPNDPIHAMVLRDLKT